MTQQNAKDLTPAELEALRQEYETLSEKQMESEYELREIENELRVLKSKK